MNRSFVISVLLSAVFSVSDSLDLIRNSIVLRRGGGGGGSSDGMGIGTVLLIIGAVIVSVFGGILALVFGAQLSNTSLFSTLPGGTAGSNATKVNQNVANGVVLGSSFLPLIYLGGFGALALAIFLLVFVIFKHFRRMGT